jgi:NADH:ubiquinone reductase (non-electrogenic)
MTSLTSDHTQLGEGIPRNRVSQAPRICIIGGGFGGLYTALYLQRYRHLKSASITLVEPRDQFLFTPLLYEVLTDELQVWEIAPTYSSLLAGTNVTWRQTRATDIDLQQQWVILQTGEPLVYDYLVVATGAVTPAVPVAGVKTHALTFRTLEDVLTLKARLDQLVTTHQPVAVTVIGGGPSGVELATKIADRFQRQAQVTLIERGDTVLKPFARGLRQAALKALKQRQVQLHLQTQVTEISAHQVLGHRGQESFRLPSDLTIWATGTQPAGWPGREPVYGNDWGQVFVRPTLQLVDYPEVFVLGDGAVTQATVSQAVPNTAQAAYQAADAVAHNLAALTRHRQLKPFHYLHLGDMLTLGYGTGGVWSFGLTLAGKLGGLVRRAVYLHRLPSQQHRWKVIRHTLTQLFLKPFSRLFAGRKRARRHSRLTP